MSQNQRCSSLTSSLVLSQYGQGPVCARKSVEVFCFFLAQGGQRVSCLSFWRGGCSRALAVNMQPRTHDSGSGRTTHDETRAAVNLAFRRAEIPILSPPRSVQLAQQPPAVCPPEHILRLLGVDLHARWQAGVNHKPSALQIMRSAHLLTPLNITHPLVHPRFEFLSALLLPPGTEQAADVVVVGRVCVLQFFPCTQNTRVKSCRRNGQIGETLCTG